MNEEPQEKDIDLEMIPENDLHAEFSSSNLFSDALNNPQLIHSQAD